MDRPIGEHGGLPAASLKARQRASKSRKNLEAATDALIPKAVRHARARALRGDKEMRRVVLDLQEFIATTRERSRFVRTLRRALKQGWH